MTSIEKTVFISYRRTNFSWAMAIFQHLSQHGYDVFIDYTGLASGDFEGVILQNIKSRAHFLVLLTPSALKGCSSPSDWLRLEIEAALKNKRNIVPVMLEGFDFDTPAIAKQLTGKLAALHHYNALPVPPDFFVEAMDRLCKKYLNVPLKAVLHPASHSVERASRIQQAAAATAPSVSKKELTAQQLFERGFEADDLDDRLRLYSQAIRLNPRYAVVFYNRGLTRHEKGDLEGALRDYNEAIRLKSNDSDYFVNRGIVRQANGDLKGALLDFNTAMSLNPHDADIFINRANARSEKRDLKGALLDYNRAIRLRPKDADAYYNRGDLYHLRHAFKSALRDYSEAIRLQPEYAEAFNNRGIVREELGDIEGALKDYSQAISLDAEYTDALYNRALLFEEKDFYQAAIRDYQNYLDNAGGKHDGDQKEVEKAIRALKKKIGTAQKKQPRKK
jgi:tetratricopeptide (TPR) repeat protein